MGGFFGQAQLCPSCAFYLMYVHVVSGLKAMALDVALSIKKMPSHSVFNRLQVINLRWHRALDMFSFFLFVNNFGISEDVDQCNVIYTLATVWYAALAGSQG